MWQKYYNESFKYGHKVLLVSHSQGNLFANRVYDKISPTDYKEYFANLQVASPANEVKAEKGDYVTGLVDPIINPIPGSMSSNADLDFPGGHKFVEAYLSSSDTLSKIIEKTNTLLASLDTTLSQWETDQELNKDTKDYRITVKHRFDPNITEMDGVEVFPFAPSKKLYYVDGNIAGYVKASCGGTKILNSWTDQQSGEIYLINNLENETIVAESSIEQSGEANEFISEESIVQSDFTFYTSSIYETMSDLFLVTRDNEINFNPSTVLVSSIQLDVKIRENDILDFTVYVPYDFQNIKVEVYSDVISFLNSRYDKNYIMGTVNFL